MRAPETTDGGDQLAVDTYEGIDDSSAWNRLSRAHAMRRTLAMQLPDDDALHGVLQALFQVQSLLVQARAWPGPFLDREAVVNALQTALSQATGTSQ